MVVCAASTAQCLPIRVIRPGQADMPRRSSGNNTVMGPYTMDTRGHTQRTRSTRRGVQLLAGVAMVAVVGMLVAIVVRPSSSTVPVVGDSITFFAGRDISAALGSGYHADVHAGIGKRIDQMLPTVRDVMRDHPLAVVVDLGTNDALQARTHPGWLRGFQRMVATLSPAQCVML